MLNRSKMSIRRDRKVAEVHNGNYGMVKISKKCPFCGATSLYRRVRRVAIFVENANGFPFIQVEKFGRVL